MSPAIVVNSPPEPLGQGEQRLQRSRNDSQLTGYPFPSFLGTVSGSESLDDEDNDDGKSSPNTDLELNLDGVNDQDDAQAVMQPAMSAVASHFTSAYTPAIEKAAAMERLPDGGLFDVPVDDNDDDDFPEPRDRYCFDRAYHSTRSATRPRVGPMEPLILPRRSATLQQDPLPSPWHSGPKEWIVTDKAGKVTGQTQNQPRPHKSSMGLAMGSSRRHRSLSVGQDTLKRLQKAFPSLSSPTHLLPSLPTNFFSVFSDKSQSSPGSVPNRRISERSLPKLNSANTEPPQERPIITGTRLPHSKPTWSSESPHRTSSVRSRPSMASSSRLSSSRPRTLRRATSDESILYQSLSRVSSLGNDEQFQDVRDMVNMRLQAIRESLPERPSFKMPTMPKLHPPSFMSTSMLSIGDDQGGASPTRSIPNGTPTTSASPITKDGSTDLDRVLAELTGDIVVMGGLRGSVLRSAKPPHQQVWAPVKVGLNIRKVHLEIGLTDEDEERVEETIIPSGMLSHMGPVDISRKLFKKLRNCENARSGKLRIWDYGYDWRLSPHILSRKLEEFLASLPCNQSDVPANSRGAMVIAHSMGGIITRHTVNQAPHLFSGVLFAGTPQRCINILGPIRHGDVVLFNEKLLSAQVNFSIRSYYVFLPEDGFCFVDKNTRESYPIDFYNPEEWIKWRLTPSVQSALPALVKPPPANTGSPSLSSFFPTSLRTRAASQSEKWFSGTFEQTVASVGHKDRTIAPQMNSGVDHSSPAVISSSEDETLGGGCALTDPQRRQNMDYLARTLARTKTFRTESVHLQTHQSSNAYPPLAVLYGKSTPTVYAAQVNGRDGIGRADAYDDLLFRPGDGVVLAKEAMLPDGYVLVKGGRVCTERGHITMLADMHAVGKALGALVRGRKKGIGLGSRASS